MKGDSSINQNGVYGTKGVSNLTNNPPPRLSSVGIAGDSGYYFLFSGYKNGSGFPFLNDFWKYKTSTNEWTWLSGDSVQNQSAKYGIRGVPSILNKPGARYSSSIFKDINGSIWIFGGYGKACSSCYSIESLNDLWRYNPSSNEWTWFKGDSAVQKPGIYGSKGVSSINNNPGSRFSSMTWSDLSGNLWLFGGQGWIREFLSGDLNDLWKYNITTNEWTWMKGDTSSSVASVYGQKGISSINNKLGSRFYSTTWTDLSGNLWLFGGNSYSNTSSNYYYNDLWKFNSNSNEWIWISGDSIPNNTGNYGNQGVTNLSNNPGARNQSSGWMDSNGILWLFGGYGYASNSITTKGYLNDLWKFNTLTNEWTWVKGDSIINVNGIYGTKASESSSNKIGAKYNAKSWSDNSGNFWFYGGYGFGNTTAGYLNDLWRLGVASLPIVLNKFNVARNVTSAILYWSTVSEINNKYFEVQRSIDGKQFSAIGITEAKGFASEYLYKDEKPFVGINYYRLKQVDIDGKFSFSETKSVKFDGDGKLSFVMYPNPTKEKVNVFVNAFSGKGEIIITDISGKQIQQQVLVIGNNTIEIKNLSKGIYFVNIITDKEKQTQKLVVE